MRKVSGKLLQFYGFIVIARSFAMNKQSGESGIVFEVNATVQVSQTIFLVYKNFSCIWYMHFYNNMYLY